MATMNRWDPFTALARLDTEFDELVRRAWATTPANRAGQRTRTTSGYVPAIDMRVDGGDVIVTLELPGVDVEKDVDIEVADGRLTISGQRHEKSTSENANVVVRELRYGAFRREFALPEGVGAEDVDAVYDKGMLHVRVRNVTKPAVPPQKIQIRATGSGTEQRSIQGSVEQEPSS